MNRSSCLPLAAAVLVFACGGDDATPSTDEVGEATDTETETETGTESETDTEPEPDLPAEPERGSLSSPAEAVDLDPAPDVVHVELTAAPHSFEIAGEMVDGWAYNGQVPGPTIRMRRGDTLVVDFHNDLEDPTTVHWHGLHVPFEMDGVTWQGAPVEPGGDFVYTFTLDQAGTYWYHPHVDTERQADLGLYGVLIVEDPDEPVADRELVVVFDSWGEHDADSREGGHHGLDGADLTWTANGLIDPLFEANAGESIRLRAVNVANAGYVDLTWTTGGEPGVRQIASDQGLLPELVEASSVVLAPSDRADFEWLVGPDFAGLEVLNQPYSLLGAPSQGEPLRLFEVELAEGGTGEPAPGPLAWPFDGLEPTPDPGAGVTDVLYAFHGDPHTGDWTINGELFPDITIESLSLGAWSVVELRNVSQAAHPFHLHGHAFEVLSVDGEPPPWRIVEDTFDVPPYATVRLGLLPDNPGDWMAHCHILPHVEGGMMTVLRVE